MGGGAHMSPSPCPHWDVYWLSLLQILCKQPQLLWVYEYRCPVMSSIYCFAAILHDLWFLQSFNSLFQDVPWALMAEVWYKCPSYDYRQLLEFLLKSKIYPNVSDLVSKTRGLFNECPPHTFILQHGTFEASPSCSGSSSMWEYLKWPQRHSSLDPVLSFL